MGRNAANQDYLDELNRAWSDAKEGANTLREQLAIRQRQISDLASAGGVGSLVSVGKNSANQSMRGHGPGSLTATELKRIIVDLVGLCDRTKNAITCAFQAAGQTIPAGFDFDGDEIYTPPQMVNGVCTQTCKVGIYIILCRAFSAPGTPERGDITNLNLSFPPYRTAPDQSLEPDGVLTW